jgi:hypothetical protein
MPLLYRRRRGLRINRRHPLLHKAEFEVNRYEFFYRLANVLGGGHRKLPKERVFQLTAIVGRIRCFMQLQFVFAAAEEISDVAYRF